MVHEQNMRVQAAHRRPVAYADGRDATCLAEVVEHRLRLLRQGTARFRVYGLGFPTRTRTRKLTRTH
jgi:hypothetical protein